MQDFQTYKTNRVNELYGKDINFYKKYQYVILGGGLLIFYLGTEYGYFLDYIGIFILVITWVKAESLMTEIKGYGEGFYDGHDYANHPNKYN